MPLTQILGTLKNNRALHLISLLNHQPIKEQPSLIYNILNIIFMSSR